MMKNEINAIVKQQKKRDVTEHIQSRTMGESLYSMIPGFLRKMDWPQFLKKNGSLDEAAFYKYARIEKNTWSNIRLGNTTPRKETMLKLVIALELDEGDAAALLAKASYSFNDTDPRDMVILSCIETQCYDIETVYEILEEYANAGAGGSKRFRNIY